MYAAIVKQGAQGAAASTPGKIAKRDHPVASGGEPTTPTKRSKAAEEESGAPPPPKQEEQKQPQEQTPEQQEEKQQPEAKQGEQQEQEQQQQPQQHDADGDTAMDEGTAGAPSADAAPGEPQGEQQDAKPKRAAKPPHPTYDDAHTVFVRGMGREVTEADLRQLFADVPGLKDIRLALDRYDKSPRGFAYAEFEGLEGVCAAVALSGTSIKGRSLHILRSRPPRAADAADHTAFIKGLGEGVGEAELRQLLGDAPGGIRDVRLPKDETGAFKGFAYVEFETDEGLQHAVAKHGTEVNGQQLLIAKSAPPRGGARGGRTHHVAGRRGGGRGRGGGGRSGGRGGGGGGDATMEEEGGGDAGGAGDEGGEGGWSVQGGRGRGRGGARGRGRGRGGRSMGLPYVPVSGGRGSGGSGGHQRDAVQVEDGHARVRNPRVMPRAAGGAQQGGADAVGGDGKAKSNDEFRQMLLAEGK